LIRYTRLKARTELHRGWGRGRGLIWAEMVGAVSHQRVHHEISRIVASGAVVVSGAQAERRNKYKQIVENYWMKLQAVGTGSGLEMFVGVEARAEGDRRNKGTTALALMISWAFLANSDYIAFLILYVPHARLAREINSFAATQRTTPTG